VSDDFVVNVDNSTLNLNGDVVRVAPSGITSSQIADGSVASIDIANNTLTTADIATGGVASDEILDNSIAEADIQSPGNNYVLTTDGSGNVSWATQNSFNSAQAGDGLIADGNEIDANVDNSTIEISADQLRVKAEGITANEIATGAVTTDEILDGTIQSVDVANNTLTAADIATGAITTDEILDGTILSVDVANNTLTADDIATGAVTSDEILNGTIQSIDVANNSLTADDLATGAVTTDEILNGTILPIDVSSPGGPNLVLSTNASNVVGWNDPNSLVNTLEDGDSDTYISVDNGSDDDNIRFFNQTAENMTIDATGEVGIGTNTPERDLHVVAATGGQILASRGDANTNTGETLGELMFDSEDDTDPSTTDASAVIRGIAAENHGNSNKGGHLAFLTKNNTALSSAPATERMRITSTGNVGIGTNIPSAKLDVVGTSELTGDLDITGTVDIVGSLTVSSLDANTNSVVMADANGLLYPSNDLPGGDNSYIQNQNSIDQAANFRINGTGEAFVLRTRSGDGEKIQLTSAGAAGSKIRHTTGWAIDYHAGPGAGAVTGSHRFYTTGTGGTYRERLGIESSGRIHIRQDDGGDPAFAGLESPATANGRAQLVLSSSYSDLVIASREGNNNHGSTLTFATYNPGNANDYRKFVINQGNWGNRRGFLDFGYSDAGGRTNPHANINATDNVVTMDGFNKRVGIGTMTPDTRLDVHGTATISRDGTTECCSGGDYTLAITENTAGTGRRASISFHNAGVAEGTIRLAENYNMAGLPYSNRRIHFFDWQSSGLGLELEGNLFYGNNSSRTQTRDDNRIQGSQGALSGFYETSTASAGEGYPSGSGGWWHLIDARHSNPSGRKLF
jgi:hypothetical protein